MTPIQLLARILITRAMIANGIRPVYPAIPRPTEPQSPAQQRDVARKVHSAEHRCHDDRPHRGELIRSRR